jgi:hypothetical protein
VTVGKKYALMIIQFSETGAVANIIKFRWEKHPAWGLGEGIMAPNRKKSLLQNDTQDLGSGELL